MLKKVNIKGVFYVSGLILLLLFAPCNTRHQLQTFFGTPQTKVHNLNKANFNNINCKTNTAENVILRALNSTFKTTKTFATDKEFILSNQFKVNQSLPLTKDDQNELQSDSVPYYILFRKLKIHV